MRKRMLSILLSLCMLFSLAPASVFAQDELEEIDECICETQCSEESINNDCPVCSKEGATLEDCGLYVPVIEEVNETIINPINENNDEDSINNEVLENESNEESNTVVLENEESNITSKDVQDLIDALPDTTTINEDNVEEIEAQLEAIDNLKAELSDEELDSVDFTRYVEVATVLEQLMYGVQESSNQIMPASYSGRSIRLGTSGIRSPRVSKSRDKIAHIPNSYIYFGTYNNTPIKWRVLDASKANDGTTNGMFLLSEYLLASDLAFNWVVSKNNVYQGSDAQGWCIGFAKNRDNFSVLEQSAMLGIAKNDGISAAFPKGYTWGESSLTVDDKMFLLSVQELADYVANYDGPALKTSFLTPGLSANDWLLRTPCWAGEYTTSFVGSIVLKHGNLVLSSKSSGNKASRPAFNLNLDSILYTSTAIRSKWDANVDDRLFAVNTVTNIPEWRITLKDSSRNFSASASTTKLRANESLTITYSGAKTGDNEYVSAMIVDENDDVLYYGRIAQNSESGTATITIPSEMATGNYKLKVFSEQCNGDYKTDYASNFVNIDLKIREKFSEQFTLTKGERYYFDLSGLSIPGTINSYLPDTSLHYVPFVYTGTIDAYVLKPASNHVVYSSKQASETLDYNAEFGYTYDHSLFMADDLVTIRTRWVDLNNEGYIFGNSYVANGIEYSLRAPTVGSSESNISSRVSNPSNNEWDQILDKNSNYIIVNNNGKPGVETYWGQDTFFENSGTKKSLRNQHRIIIGRDEDEGTAHYRPVLEVLNPKTLGNDGLKEITLSLGGGKLGGSVDDIKIVVKNNGTYTAPSYEGLTRPDGNNDTYFYWLGSDGNSYLPKDTVSADVETLTAKWEPLKYSVTLKVNGGVINNNNITEYVYGQGATLPSVSDMTKEGYSFGGWYTSSDFSDSPVTNIDATDRGNKTYYAKWNVNQYTISFDTSGGSVVSPITQDYGSTVVKPLDPTKVGYTFTGWEPEIPDTIPSSDLNIKAKWSVNKYTISFDTDGGSEVLPIIQDYGSLVIAPISPTKVGYSFIGWDNPIPSTMPSSDKLIKAVWKINKYTITFDTNGGSVIEPITQDYGSTIVKPLDPTRSGYTFVGWDLSIPDTMPPNDMTIKAKWLDSEKPSGEIKVATNSWKTLLNSISFGLFFKDSQTVGISAIDNSNEEVKIEYLLSNNLLSITELDNQTFSLYTRPFSINPNNEYVIYVKLTDTSNNVSYISSDGLVLDDISPLIKGVEDNKTYCEKKTVTVNDKYINSVKVNGNDVTLDSNNSFILGYGKQNIIVIDKSANRSVVNVTINNGHSFGGYNFDGVDTHTRKCNVCGSSETYKCIDENKDHKCDVCSGLISKCVDLNRNHKCDVCGKTISLHKGGDATCNERSICNICGQEYGELSKHLNLKHIEETKATTTSVGNKEYWYCEECNRYYSDKDGLNEISKKDTVIERLKDDNTNKDDNNVVEIEHKDSNPIIWAVVPVVGVAIISGIILIIKRKR